MDDNIPLDGVFHGNMKVEFGRASDIDSWMQLVRKVSWNFPGLETEQSIDKHKIIVLKFMNDKRALCVKNEQDIVGVLLYSRKPRKLYKKFGFEEGELIEEFGYPNQRFVLHANKSADNVIIGTTVTVTVDRPLGSYHPEYKDIYYPINYGYIEGIMAPDGEEQDAYILGVNEPVDKFTGKIIAIVHRKDDIEEKWVVVPDGITFSKEEIRRQIYFQEQYFDSEIVM